MATSQVSAQARGVIVVLEGKAWVLDSSGNRVLLKVGDEVQEGQVIVTDTGTRLELALPNGQVVSVSTGRELLIDANLLGLAPTDRSEAALEDLNSGSAQVARIIQSGGDLSTELDPTAAGQAGGDTSESHSFVRVLRIVENLAPLGLDRVADAIEDLNPILGKSELSVIVALPPANTGSDVPVAVADTPVGVTEDTPFTASLASNDTPSGDGGNVWSKTTDPANGTVTVTAAGVFTYTPNANFNGVDSFTYTITDADGSTSSATVTLNVGAVNDVPVAVADTPVGVTEDTPFTASLASNDTPSGDGGNVWSKTTDPANGTVTVTAAGVFTYPQRQLQWRGQLHLHHHRRRWLHLQGHRHPQCGRRQ
ncbi:MAG: retention module-containing protein [Rhodoferax sp.]|nr:retention module-containing protein [Rhodoferax sp.]